MAWAVKITVEAHELHRPLGANDDIALRGYTFIGPLARGQSLRAVWARMEQEVHAHLIDKMEPQEKVSA